MNTAISATAAIILGAGNGKRMKSNYPKVLCEVLGKPMILWVTDSCAKAGIAVHNTCVVISDDCGNLPEVLPQGVVTRVQHQRLGTGHAVMSALDFIAQSEISDLLVLYGDTPFVDQTTMESSYAFHKAHGNHTTVITAHLTNPDRYGRILREEGKFQRIVEYTDANEAQRAITEINSGIYWFDKEILLATLPLLKPANAQGELYLTDTIELALGMGKQVEGYISSDSYVVQGANNRKGLAELNHMARERILDALYEQGVNIPISEGVMISPDTVIDSDTTISPCVSILGSSTIGSDCQIGQSTLISGSKIGNNCCIGSAVTIINSQIGDHVSITSGSYIENAIIGEGCQIQSSVIKDSTVGKEVRVGPYAQLRPGSKLADKVKIGNFVEVKNSVLGEKTSVAHLSYIGDSDVGARVNFGCGTVIVNYDGYKKSRTTIGDDVFIGCNSNLIAPVTLEDDCYVAAATTVTQTVPTNAMAIGRVRQENKLGYKLKFKK